MPSTSLFAAGVPTVVQLVQSLGEGGLEAMSVNLAIALQARGIRAVLVGVDRGGLLEPRMRAHGIEYHVLGGAHARSPVAHLRMARLLHRLRADVVHTHHLPPLLVGALAARLRGARLVHTEHAFQYLEAEPRVRPLLRAASRACHAFVLVGAEMHPFYERAVGVAPERLRVIPNGIDSVRFSPLPPEAVSQRRHSLGLPDGFLVGAVSRLARVKNLPMLLRAFATVRAARLDAQLVLVGDGEERQALEAQAAALGMADAVHFLGWRTDVPDVVATLDVLALSSWSEGLPLVVLEAMAAGIPPVVTAVGDLPRVVDSGRQGLVVPIDDDAAMASALLALSNDRTLRDRLAHGARERVVAEFSQQAMVDAYLRAYGLPVHAP